MEETIADNQLNIIVKRREKLLGSDGSCPIRHVLDRFGDKWSILIIILLNHNEKLRFNELSHQIGDISQKMLTSTLRSLEADGLLTREYFPEIPPRVEYQLTDLGRSLFPLIEKMNNWAEQNIELIKKNRKKYDETNIKR